MQLYEMMSSRIEQQALRNGMPKRRGSSLPDFILQKFSSSDDLWGQAGRNGKPDTLLASPHNRFAKTSTYSDVAKFAAIARSVTVSGLLLLLLLLLLRFA